MSNRIVDVEIIEISVDPALAQLHLRVEVEEWTPKTEIRARLVGPRNALARTVETSHVFKTTRPLDADDGPEVRNFKVALVEPSLWSPATPCRYEGQVELWQDGMKSGEMPLHYSLYTLSWVEDEILLNDEELAPRLVRVATLDEATALRLRQEGVNVVLLPASEVEAWDLADRLGLMLIGELAADGVLPPDLMDRSVRPCCLGWVFPHIDTPMPSEMIPGLFGLLAPVPFTELPEGIDFLLLEAPPDEDDLGYPWLAIR